ncbi:MAG TPA: autotransporter outer membrane beta-barrel domain-containing protein, partial [Caulobacteraceae bacterium]|nr:autotransporter outer membrane beta-barrel domain-containing protein [Caulobacteraceae bacterium]
IDGRANGDAPGVWLKIVGNWNRRSGSDSLTLFNKTYTFNTGYNADTAALIGGVDFLRQSDKTTAWALGVEGGYVDTNVRFRAGGTRTNLTGGTFGVYGTYMQGGLFVDGLVSGNFMRGQWSIPGMNVNPNLWQATGDVTTWGGRLEAGYVFPVGAAAFIEPVGSLAYGRTSFDDLTVPGGTQQIADANTFRGSLGARVGTTASYQYFKVKLALEGRVWDEFDGKTNGTLIVAGGPNFLTNDNIDGVFGEIKGEANLFAVGNNLSAFLNTGVKWKSRYQDTTVTLGFRYQW